MNRKKLVLVAGAMALAIVVMALKCGDEPPTVPTITPPTGAVYQNAEVTFKFMSTQPQEKNVKYVADWGDGTVDTSAIDYPSGTEATRRHTWTTPGDYDVKALAIVAEKPELASDWSAATTVTIGANDAPTGVRITYAPLQTARNRDTRFEAFATDPEGDSIAYRFDYDVTGGGDYGDWTAFVTSATPGEDYHKFSKLGVFYVKVQAKDLKGSISGWSDSVQVTVDTTGVVVWVWVSPDEDSGNAIGSVLIGMNGEDELAYVGAEDYYGKFYGISTIDGKTKKRGSANEPEEYFTGHPAFCAATGNIIVGCEDGDLYGFTSSLSKSWSWPDTGEANNIEWGVPAISGNKVYCTRDDDRLYYLTDNGGSVTYTSSYYIRGIRGNPVVDNSGQVIVVTDSGRLHILDANLNPVWDSLLTSGGKSLLSPILGSAGTIYVGDEAGWVYAVNPTHSIKWKAQVSGEANRIVLSTSAVFVATGSGKIYKLNPETGAAIWNITLTGASEVAVCPILTANGLMYIHDDQDVLHCIKQDDGAYLWLCNCEEFAPMRSSGRRGRRDFENPEYSPAIAANGDILVVGADALYCVAGYTAATLMPSAWPKWQSGKANTGKAGGF